MASLGLVRVLAGSEAVSDASGYQSWTTQTWRQNPEEVVKREGLLLPGTRTPRIFFG